MTYNPAWIVDACIKPGDGKGALIAHPALMQRLFAAHNYSALAAYQGIIRGEMALENPVAVYKGIRRPLHRVGVDNFIFVYIYGARCDYRYAKPKNKTLDSLLPPANSVFVTFVSLSRDVIAEARNALGGCELPQLRGVMLGWEWTHASAKDESLPDGYAKRYKKCIWERS